jgi:broad specificity phosphatase PhoE
VTSKNSIVILTRHGETAWNRTRRLQGRLDISLSEEGIEEARNLSAALSSVPISEIYCSPLSRSRETAEILGSPHGLTPKVKDAFMEADYGSWEGKSSEYLRKIFPHDFDKWIKQPTDVQIPNAENLECVQKRVVEGFMEVLNESNANVIAIVGHGGVNRALLLSLLNADLKSFWRIRQDNVCVNLIEVAGEMFRVSLLNSTVHLRTDYCALVLSRRGQGSLMDYSARQSGQNLTDGGFFPELLV